MWRPAGRLRNAVFPDAAGPSSCYGTLQKGDGACMIEQIKGRTAHGKGNYAIVVSRFNDFITSKLLDGAIDCLERHGAAEEQIRVVWVPGAGEIPLVAKKLAAGGEYVAVLCLGAGVRGQH